jgi:hypothetical protein
MISDEWVDGFGLTEIATMQIKFAGINFASHTSSKNAFRLQQCATMRKKGRLSNIPVH